MATPIVGTPVNHHSLTATNSVAYSATAGNNLLVLVSLATNTVSLADTLGNTYTNVFPVAAGISTAYLAAFWATDVLGGDNTITATMGAPGGSDIFVVEYSGSWDFDVASLIKGTSFTNSSSTNSATPSVTGDIAVAFIGNGGSSGITFSAWTNGFTQEDSSASGPSAAWADQLLSSAAAISAGVTLSSSTSTSGILLLFKPGGGGSGGSTIVQSETLMVADGALKVAVKPREDDTTIYDVDRLFAAQLIVDELGVAVTDVRSLIRVLYHTQDAITVFDARSRNFVKGGAYPPRLPRVARRARRLLNDGH